MPILQNYLFRASLIVPRLFSLATGLAQVNRPLLVKLSSEKDKAMILKNAAKLRHMSDRWPNVSIVLERTKCELAAFKELRTECKLRQSRGEYVIFFNNAIMPANVLGRHRIQIIIQAHLTMLYFWLTCRLSTSSLQTKWRGRPY